jgi:1-acyl-sn-glycerol-3-phosphate acyltransferase
MPTNLQYDFAVRLIRLYSQIMFKLDICASSPLPAGPKLLVANHPSATDAFLIHLLSSNPVSALISSNAFEMPFFGRFLQQCDQIPISPGRGRAALEQAAERLRSGKTVAIFLEGHISPPEGGFHPPRAGAAWLALTTGVPVIPVGIYLPRDRNLLISSKLTGKQTSGYWYLQGPYGMSVGEPIRYAGNVNDQNVVRGVMMRMMEKIQELSGESERRVGLAPSAVPKPLIS